LSPGTSGDSDLAIASGNDRDISARSGVHGISFAGPNISASPQVCELNAVDCYVTNTGHRHNHRFKLRQTVSVGLGCRQFDEVEIDAVDRLMTGEDRSVFVVESMDHYL
jgi:hypothetical protein